MKSLYQSLVPSRKALFLFLMSLFVIFSDTSFASCCGGAGRTGGRCFVPAPNAFRRAEVIETRKCALMEFQFQDRCCRCDYQKQCSCCGCSFRVPSYCCDPVTCCYCPKCGYPCRIYDWLEDNCNSGCSNACGGCGTCSTNRGCNSCGGCCGVGHAHEGGKSVLGDVNLFKPIVKSYTVTAGDSLSISVLGLDESVGENITVAPDGYIYFSFLEGIYVDGLTVDEIKEEVRKRFVDYFVEPQVTVVANYMSKQTYTVMGRVNGPGVFPLNEAITLREAILLAGGIMSDLYSPSVGYGSYVGLPTFGTQGKPVTNLRNSYILRDGVKIKPDIEKLLYTADTSQNMMIKPGDYIYIAPNDTKDILILGATGAPGYIIYEDGMTLVQALITNGGWINGPYGADTQKILVIRGSLKCPKVMAVDLCCVLAGNARDVYMEPGDVIFVTNKQFRFGRELVRLAIDSIVASFTNSLGDYYADEILN